MHTGKNNPLHEDKLQNSWLESELYREVSREATEDCKLSKPKHCKKNYKHKSRLETTKYNSRGDTEQLKRTMRTMKMNTGLENANKMVLAYKEKTEDIMVCKPVKRRLQVFLFS